MRRRGRPPRRTRRRASWSRGRRRRRRPPVGRRRSGRSRSRRIGDRRANSACGRCCSTWFQPMCGSVGASSSRAVRPARMPERRGAVLVAAVEQELQAEADAEERPVGRDPVAGSGRRDRAGRGGPWPDRRPRRRARPARRCPSRSVAIPGDGDVGADRRQRLLDAHEVAGAVVDDGDPRCGRGGHGRGCHARHPSAPFVDATPVAARVGLAGDAQRPRRAP